MADSVGFRRIAEWIRSDDEIKAIVLSAGGKTSNSKKVTDLLIDASNCIFDGQSVVKSLTPFIERVIFDAEAIGLTKLIKDELMKVGQEVEKHLSLDFILSRGEYFYAKLFSYYYGLPFVDSAELIGFYDDGKLNMGLSEYQFAKAYEKYGKFVCGGFYGALSNGKIKTFTRGGSDFSGAIATRGLKAKEYLNFTDVDGVFPFSPKLRKSAVIKEISFDTIRLLGEFGTTVLHPASVLPLYGTQTQIIVKNTFNKFANGTTVKENTSEKPFAVGVKENCIFFRGIKRGQGHEIYDKIAKMGNKIISGVWSLDFANVLCQEKFDEGVLEGLGLDFCQIQENVSVFYLTASKRSDQIIGRLQEQKLAMLISTFKYGSYLVVKKEDVAKVEQEVYQWL